MVLKVYNRFKQIGRIHIRAYTPSPSNQLVLSISADNVKELLLTLKYTIYILNFYYESMKDKRFHTFSTKKKIY